ncbi:hypothetical protein GH5_03451 [Leishmania sp. Ghana 2012 LV757]|uniref:hypothetical protein n=1 Tax=Leishmania sp. Ghana 2012 LV757 TaxID=2803181 RepID=UPI001B4FA0C9|nr:hypothetical protein GH5_03451 [Leishmania sp. Ghana 2012 LV757]
MGAQLSSWKLRGRLGFLRCVAATWRLALVILCFLLLRSISLVVARRRAPVKNGRFDVYRRCISIGAAVGAVEGPQGPPPAGHISGAVSLRRRVSITVSGTASQAEELVKNSETFFQVAYSAAVERRASAPVIRGPRSGHAIHARGCSSGEVSAAKSSSWSPSAAEVSLLDSSSETSEKDSSSFSPAPGKVLNAVDERRSSNAPSFSSSLSSPGRGKGRLPSIRRALLGLIALVVPAAIIGFVVWCIYRRTRYVRKVKDLRLNGTRRPGEVDDKEMGNAVRGGDWLHLEAAITGITGIGANRSRFSISAPSATAGGCTSDIFDPIGQQAAEARQRKRARRVTVAAAEAAGSLRNRGGSGNLASPLGESCSAAELEMWSSDEERDANGSSLNSAIDGCSFRGAGDPAQIFATTLVLSGTGNSGAGVSLGISPSLSGGALPSPKTTVVPPLSRNPEYFNETARVLLGRYTSESEVGGPQMPPSEVPDGGGAGSQSMWPVAGNEGGSSKAVLEKPRMAFEQILSSAVAPLQVGVEFHQRGDNADSGKVTDGAGEPKGLAAPAPRPLAQAEKRPGEEVFEGADDEEEEHAFHDEV